MGCLSSHGFTLYWQMKIFEEELGHGKGKAGSLKWLVIWVHLGLSKRGVHGGRGSLVSFAVLLKAVPSSW